jgi:hypothetical protein
MGSSEPREPRGSEAGDTLVEVLLALVVIALTAVAILGAFATSISATTEHRTLANADSVIRSFAEYATYEIELSSNPSWVSCATPSDYNPTVSQFGSSTKNPNVFSSTNPSGYKIAITIQDEGPGCTSDPTNPSDCRSPSSSTSCPPEMITATASLNGTADAELQFVVSQPESQKESASQSTINPATYSLPPGSSSAPAGGGGTITITATSGSFANATTVNFGTTRQPATVGGGGSWVSATIPPESGSQYQVFITVTTPTGTTAAGPTDLFTYGPTVTNISPNTGPFAGGTSVTVTGTGFTANSSVSFGGTAATVTSFNGSTTLIVTAPAGSGTVDVGVTNPALSNGTSPTSTADHFTYAMNVTSVSPPSGPNAGGTPVDIKGQGFTGVTGVTFSGVPATGVTFISDGEITAVSPAGAGTVDVQVTTPSGTTAPGTSDQFSYTGSGSTMAGLGMQLNGASPSPTLSCKYNASGHNACSVSGVGCGGSVTFYVETIDGNGNPVDVTLPGGQGIAVSSGATPSGVTIPQGSFTTYAAPPGSQSVTAQLSPPTCKKNGTESETVTLSTTINSNPVTLAITVSS